jgi:hypothetical protein
VAKGTAPRFPLAQALKISDMAEVQKLETIDQRLSEPWNIPGEQGPNKPRKLWSEYKKKLEEKMMKEWKME